MPSAAANIAADLRFIETSISCNKKPYGFGDGVIIKGWAGCCQEKARKRTGLGSGGKRKIPGDFP
ncbi:hypothetical protein BACCAP_04173 [Pseudoflavonifractor capillosus ATCC 29799]|uniref:Uncharacterized protein n=1 Tax=Pseudoflavonifractor capillosus ATCC 29799 TaxID=411467 RepID=A6P105_9FIRM|nr:hypothetical protein BACCAP_04173 [Pseudoflavonifractor capillosus ATCC 29799]